MEEVRGDLSPYVPEPSLQDYRRGWQEPEPLSHAVSAERAAEAYDRAAHAYDREAKAFEREAHTYEREAEGDFDAAIPPSFVRPAGYEHDTPRLAPGEGREERRRRPGLYAVVAVLGVVVIAAAGFLAFRGAGGEETPPVIAADDSPIRILPDEATVDETAQPGDAVFDQIDPVAGQPETETLLPQPDQPVEDVAAAGVAVDPIAALASQNTEISQAPASGEPRRVRTITIGPDGQVLSNDAETVGEDAAAAPDNVAFVAPDETTDQVVADSAADDDPIVIDPVVTEPISLAPANNAALAEEPVTPAPAANDVAPVDLLPQGAVATPPAGFYVQVASVGSEEVARSQFQSLQARAPSLLANRTMVIQQADIPGRGTFYRIQIGPMSQADAETLRASLRSSGVVPDAIIAQH
jgi:hypothetical protein